jgi:hypothetical protein
VTKFNATERRLLDERLGGSAEFSRPSEPSGLPHSGRTAGDRRSEAENVEEEVAGVLTRMLNVLAVCLTMPLRSEPCA